MVKNKTVLGNLFILISMLSILVSGCQPSNDSPRELTESEKEKVIALAVEAAAENLGDEDVESLRNHDAARVDWALHTDSVASGWRDMKLQDALNYGPIEETDAWYIEVKIWFKQKERNMWIVQVRIDLETEVVIDIAELTEISTVEYNNALNPRSPFYDPSLAYGAPGTRFGPPGQKGSGMPAPEPPPPPLPEVTLKTDKGIYMAGEEVMIKLIIKNPAKSEVSFIYPPEIRIWHITALTIPGGREIGEIPAGNETIDLKPGGTIEREFIWAPKGILPAWLELRPVGNFTASPGGFLIQYPQGAKETVIETQQSETIQNIEIIPSKGAQPVPTTLTITLERIELSANGTKFVAIATSHTPDIPDSALIKLLGDVRGEYFINNMSINAGLAEKALVDGGVRLTWPPSGQRTDPVPSDAEELTFNIKSRFYYQPQGPPWGFESLSKFHIPLE